MDTSEIIPAHSHDSVRAVDREGRRLADLHEDLSSQDRGDEGIETAVSQSMRSRGKECGPESQVRMQEKVRAADVEEPELSETVVVHDSERVEERNEENGQAHGDAGFEDPGPAAGNDTSLSAIGSAPQVPSAEIEEVEAVNQDPTVGPRIKRLADLDIDDFPLPIRSWCASFIHMYQKMSSTKRYYVSSFIYFILDLALQNEHMQDRVPQWRCYTPCDKVVEGWVCSRCKRHYRDRNMCLTCNKDIRSHMWRRGLNPKYEEERERRRGEKKKSDQWKKHFDDWVDEHDDFVFRACNEGWYRCGQCVNLSANGEKPKREGAADLGYFCKPCAEKDLADEQRVLIQNLDKHRRKRLEYLGFKEKDKFEEELPKHRERRLMKALYQRQVEPGFSEKRDAAGIWQVCWCNGQACDSWPVKLRLWPTDTHWPCPGPPHLDEDERINPHMADFDNGWDIRIKAHKDKQVAKKEMEAESKGTTVRETRKAMTAEEKKESDKADVLAEFEEMNTLYKTNLPPNSTLKDVQDKARADYKQQPPEFKKMNYWQEREEASKVLEEERKKRVAREVNRRIGEESAWVRLFKWGLRKY
ncbi:hypothetical protein EG328_011341 [Venturia inaequalis]|uniref:Uncharacterized protein n=1 Tax=Venturia inaequalis TaxID=5025 RepID=A0A8H3V5Q2_VENIN|nr:hypothetical protein EG328_011341 [Venturia inaequalis]